MDKKLLDEIVWNEWSKGRTADIKPLGSDFVMDTMPFKGRFRHSVRDEKTFTYEAEGKFISLKPTGMWWVVGEEEVSVSSVNSSTGSLVEGKIEYPDALGSGVDIELSTERKKWQKKIAIRSPESLGAIPAKAEFLEIGFEVETDFDIEGWDKKSDYMFDKAVKLGEMSRIEPVKVWDSCKEEVTKAFFKAINGRLYLIKRIPTAYLKDAVYPVYTDITIAYGTAVTFNAANTNYVHCAALDATHFVITYRDITDNYGKAIIGVVSGGDTITFGSVYTFNEAVTVYCDCAALDATHFVVAFEDDGGSDYGIAMIGVVSSGDVITFGSEYTFNAAITYNVFCDALDSTHFVVAYYDDAVANHGTAIIGVVTGDAIAYGSEYTFSTDAPQSVAALDATHFVVAYYEAGAGYPGKAMIGVVTGDAIAYGSGYAFNAATTYTMFLWGLDATHFVVAFADDGDAGQGIAMIGTVSSGDVIAYGSEYEFNAAATIDISCTKLDATHFVVAFRDEGGADYGIAMIGVVSGGDVITFGSEYTFNARITSSVSCAAIDGTHFAVGYYNSSDIQGSARIGVVSGLPSKGMCGLNPALIELIAH